MNTIVTGERMKKIWISGLCLVFLISMVILSKSQKEEVLETNNLSGTIIAKNETQLTVQDKDNVIYTFKTSEVKANIGENVILTYMGLLNKNTELQDSKILEYTVAAVDEGTWNENDLFGAFYEKAKNKVANMTLEEKIGQLLLIRFNETDAKNIVNNYNPAGFVFYEKDFQNKTEDEVKKMINEVQNVSKIPLLTSVDEEGGKIVRISNNPNLVPTPFKSPSEIYEEGGMSLIRQDTIYKSAILKNLGLNVNLAPVVDVATDPDSYIYDRTLKQDTEKTSEYAKSVIEASKNTGVSYTLKHFPGYGNNSDTHVAQAVDTRTYDYILTNDLPPFKAGIESGAEAVLVSHNIITNVDSNNPASLSKSIHNLLRNQLKFTGVIITDDVSMASTASITNKNVEAILAGNDLIITTDYEESIKEIKTALNNQTLSEVSINNAATRVIAWKYYKGLMVDKEK